MIKRLTLGLIILSCFTLISSQLSISKISVLESPLGMDKTPPSPAQYLISPEGEISNDKLTFSGLAEANSIVRILVNDKVEKEVLVGDNANFTVTIPLSKGQNLLSLVVVDSSGNISEPSNPIKVNRI